MNSERIAEQHPLSGQTITIPVSVAFPVNTPQTMETLGLRYDLVVSCLKVIANGVAIPLGARIQLYVGALLQADLSAYAASRDAGQSLREIPAQITQTDLIRVRGDLPEGTLIVLSGIGMDEFDPQRHEDWIGASPTRPANG